MAEQDPLWYWRNRRRCYRQLRNLISVLDAVYPDVAKDPNFLDRSLLMGGVSLRATPRYLLDERLGLDRLVIEATVLVRDAEFEDSVGLIVLRHAQYMDVAAASWPRPGVFRHCFKASVCGYTRFHILDALEDRLRRQATADLFRSLVPPEYLVTDAERDDRTFHLSCVFLRGPSCSSSEGAAYNLCNISREVLLGSGPMTAVIIGPDHDVALLVYYDAQGTERIGTRATQLRERMPGLGMYDSSLFPLPAGAADEAATAVRRLLPPFITGTAADYVGRVVLLENIRTETCDAAYIVEFISQAGLGYGLEAVIVHRALGDVYVVFQRQSQSELLIMVPPEEWFEAFKRQVRCQLLELEAIPIQQQQLAPPVQHLDLSRLNLGLRQWLNPAAFERAGLEIITELECCPDHNFIGLSEGLIRLAALSEPHALRRRYFPDRAVLLTRTDIYLTQSYLRIALARYGSLDALVYLSPRRIALAIFTSWTGAARLLREPAVTLMRLGFGDCRPAAVLDVGFLSQSVMERVFFFHGRLPPWF